MKPVRGDGSLPLETFRGEAPVGAVEPGQFRTSRDSSSSPYS